MAEAADRDPCEKIRRNLEEEFIDEDKFILLNEAVNQIEEGDAAPRWRNFGPPFNFDEWTEEEC